MVYVFWDYALFSRVATPTARSCFVRGASALPVCTVATVRGTPYSLS